jgi:putative transcriptional regulator
VSSKILHTIRKAVLNTTTYNRANIPCYSAVAIGFVRYFLYNPLYFAVHDSSTDGSLFSGAMPMIRHLVFVVFFLVFVVGVPHARTAPFGFKSRNYVTGRLLVAGPVLRDPNFAQTVVFMVSHDAKGAMGLVVNRLIGTRQLAHLFRDFGMKSEDVDGDIRVHYGGPVERGRGFVLHTPDYKGPTTAVIGASVALTTNVEIVRDIAAGKGPLQSLLLFGYAGWREGQLEAEIAAGAWFSIPLDEALLFDEDIERKWERAYDRRGIEL